MEIGQWLVVRYEVQESTKTRAFIGQFDAVKKGHMWASFLRPISTRDKSGYIYGTPKIEDYSSFSFNQIVKTLDAPKIFLRAGQFMFPVHCTPQQERHSTVPLTLE